MVRRLTFALAASACVAAGTIAHAAGVRDFTRMVPSTTVTQAQASELTLTLTDAVQRPIQNWIRTAGTADKTGKLLTTFLRPPESDLVRMGQRTQTYTVNTRTKMTLGYVTGVSRQKDGATVEVTLSAPVTEGPGHLMEIVVERGPYLSIPNVAIIEEGDEQIVYLQKGGGHYTPQVIHTGLQGELYTQVLDGLKDGDQVVSVGSFFVDADNKLKSADMNSMPGMDMPGTDHIAATTVAAKVSAAAGTQAVMTEPAASSVVKAPLYMIHVMFSGPIDMKSAGINVTDKTGKPVDVGPALPMGNDGNMMMAMPKTPLPPGAYNVKWHAAAANGKALQGEFAFTAQ